MKRGTRKARGPNPIDITVGANVRARRILLGMSQEKLADKLGITFQQVQKYERGSNRVSAGRLYDIAEALDYPIESFFVQGPTKVYATHDKKPSDGVLTDRELRFVHCFRLLPETVQKSLYDLMRGLTRQGDDPIAVAAE